MGYVGNQSVQGYSSIPAKQDLTGATGTSLTLTHPVSSAESIDLFINNVRQEPTTAYSVAGTTVTLTGSVVASDDIYVVYNGLALQTTVPPDGSITAAKFASGLSLGAGYFQGENGATGDTTNGKGDIFRVHEQELNTNTTIASGDNAGAFFSLTVATGVTLTVNGNLVIA